MVQQAYGLDSAGGFPSFGRDRVDHLHEDDRKLMDRVDAYIRQQRSADEPLELSTILRMFEGIERRALPFDVAIEAVLEDYTRSGTDLGTASASLISTYPAYSKQISRAALVSALLGPTYDPEGDLTQREPPKEIGPLLHDGFRLRYELVELCGQGAFGRTYKAIDRLLSDEHGTCFVALKLLDVAGTDDEAVAVLLAEANRASAVNHLNVVQVRDRGVGEDGWAFITMEYVSGGTLLEWQPKSQAAFLDVAIQIAEGLHAIHSSGFIHSDLKPQNILMVIDKNGRLTPKLTDFGVSRVIEHYELDTESDSQIKGYGNIAFQPPEVFDRGERQSVLSDVYAFSAMLEYVATGVIIHAERYAAPAAERSGEHTLTLSPRLRTVLEQGHAPDPLQRPRTAAELATQLRAVQRNEPITGIDSTMQRAQLWSRRHPVAAVLALLMITVGPLVLAGAGKAREGWAYERGKQDAKARVMVVDRKLRPAKSARDTVYDLLDSYMAREVIRNEDALAWALSDEQDLKARIRELDAALDITTGSLLDELLIREQLIFHQMQDKTEHQNTSELIASQRNAMSVTGLLSETEADQLRLFEAINAAKVAIQAHVDGKPWQSARLFEDLRVLDAFVSKNTTSRGSLTLEASRDPRVRLAVRAAELLSSKEYLNISAVHRKMSRIYLGN